MSYSLRSSFLPLFSLCWLAFACERGGAPRAPSVEATAVAVEVGGVGFDEANHAPIILLEETAGQRVLPIWIGPFEARSIASQIEGLDSPRPNTHDLARSLLQSLGGRVLRATVTEMRGSTYYALLRIEDEDGFHDVDARPSDAIAVALRCNAPLFVDAALFDARSTPGLEKPRDDPGEEDTGGDEGGEVAL